MTLKTEQLETWAVANLERVIAIDSQSDERSDTIPSTEGQRVLSAELGRYFEALGYATATDDNANLTVTIPARLPAGASAPSLALMVHMDTALGTNAVPRLERAPAWDGGELRYPANERLHVSVADYPELAPFVGQDILHGPGDAPVGLDDKLGMAELMTLAQALAAGAVERHGELRLVFRPDEEIGRMEALTSLVSGLTAAGVTHGFTVDGIEPFEMNVENFNAAAATVRVVGAPLGSAKSAEDVLIRLEGVKSHGATAKAEGYRNATRLLLETMELLGDADITPVGFDTDRLDETSADVTLRVGAGQRGALEEALDQVVGAHARRGAHYRVVSTSPAAPATDAVARLLEQLRAFLREPPVSPLWSEESSVFEGYSNPHAILPDGDAVGAAVLLHYRLRDFDPAALQQRAAHILAAAAAVGLEASVKHQYKNMGPQLASHPELLTWASAAAEQAGVTAHRRPIRGGTGVDPFLDAGIPVGNVGTGYFAPESEKELTSVQCLGQHVRWLMALTEVVSRG